MIFIIRLTAVVYYKAMLSLIRIVSCIIIVDALLRPGEEFSSMSLAYMAFKTEHSTPYKEKSCSLSSFGLWKGGNSRNQG